MKSAIYFLIMLLSACATQKSTVQSQNNNAQSFDQMLELGIQNIYTHSPRTAINSYFEPMIAQCLKKYPHDQKVYAARSLEESLFYMAHSAANNENAIVVEPFCADAHFFKAFSLVELNEFDEAKAEYLKALEMSPENSIYRSELGNVYQSLKDWDNALKTFTKAEESAQSWSPDPQKDKELARAKRGIAFSLTELGKLDEADKKYQECLTIDKDDQKAKDELQYIQSLR
ncbi:MAG: hypothetical protein COW84_06020 [Gammaproteobacteria bacterium CG22_combo_CG10-13_8_21_14_all_40_8]|nr:MAG: hypothetical protein COW84_06020 [Gammaproteobacteria bacterium CG22_combo_CG10-13_8_21_14_all_40_8]